MTNPSHVAFEHVTSTEYGGAGLTKREYFAALALQGILASAYRDMSSDTMVQDAVEAADRIISRLNKTEPCPTA